MLQCYTNSFFMHLNKCNPNRPAGRPPQQCQFPRADRDLPRCAGVFSVPVGRMRTCRREIALIFHLCRCGRDGLLLWLNFLFPHCLWLGGKWRAPAASGLVLLIISLYRGLKLGRYYQFSVRDNRPEGEETVCVGFFFCWRAWQWHGFFSSIVSVL